MSIPVAGLGAETLWCALYGTVSRNVGRYSRACVPYLVLCPDLGCDTECINMLTTVSMLFAALMASAARYGSSLREIGHVQAWRTG